MSWGSEANPEVYAKIWFAHAGTLSLNFFHVGLFDTEITSSYNGQSPSAWTGGHPDNANSATRISVDQAGWRYLRHDYTWQTSSVSQPVEEPSPSTAAESYRQECVDTIIRLVPK